MSRTASDIIQDEIELIEDDFLKNALNPNEGTYYKGYLDALDTIQKEILKNERH